MASININSNFKFRRQSYWKINGIHLRKLENTHQLRDKVVDHCKNRKNRYRTNASPPTLLIINRYGIFLSHN